MKANAALRATRRDAETVRCATYWRTYDAACRALADRVEARMCLALIPADTATFPVSTAQSQHLREVTRCTLAHE